MTRWSREGHSSFLAFDIRVPSKESLSPGLGREPQQFQPTHILLDHPHMCRVPLQGMVVHILFLLVFFSLLCISFPSVPSGVVSKRKERKKLLAFKSRPQEWRAELEYGQSTSPYVLRGRPEGFWLPWEMSGV